MPDVVSIEYLNMVQIPDTPPHDHLKIGALVFFIRDINFDSGGKKEQSEAFHSGLLMSRLYLKDLLLSKYRACVSKFKSEPVVFLSTDSNSPFVCAPQ